MDKGKSTRGFILAMLLAVMMAMGIFLTMALPNLRAEVQREDEAELVFRGEAIANAIRAYKARTGGYPLALTDLGKLSPRIIRRLYTDPMTKDGEWALITAVQPGASGDTTGLPIVGVKSKCQKDSFLIYKGKSLISDWPFSAADNLLGLPPGLGDTAAAAASLTGTTLPGAKPASTAPGADIPQPVPGYNGPPNQTPPAQPQPANGDGNPPANPPVNNGNPPAGDGSAPAQPPAGATPPTNPPT
jgi:type II secretory pathway pseudopilin PulG